VAVLRYRPSPAVAIVATVLLGLAGARGAAAQTTVSDVPLPGGLRAALAAIGDLMAPDRAHFLAEFIRRTYNRPDDPKGGQREVTLRSLLAGLKAAPAQSDPAETRPLPRTDTIWIEDVFGGQATPQTLVSAILQSRNAALFYCGLLSLDDDTRAWLGGQRGLIAELASRHAAAFLAAAPGLRVTSAGLDLPGGAPAGPAWRALVGHRPEEPAEFVRALASSSEGRLAYFFGQIGQLTPTQIRVALNLSSPGVATRVDAARRLYAVFDHLSIGQTPEESAVARPTIDPALLVTELDVDEDDGPLVPGTRGLWNAVFSHADRDRPWPARAEWLVTPDWETPADFPWLCEQVFKGEHTQQRRRYLMVLFASRRLARAAPGDVRDAVDAVRAAGAYPALTMALERAGVTDIATFASAARRAATWFRIAKPWALTAPVPRG
jgi:hypothetical protein